MRDIPLPERIVAVLAPTIVDARHRVREMRRSGESESVCEFRIDWARRGRPWSAQSIRIAAARPPAGTVFDSRLSVAIDRVRVRGLVAPEILADITFAAVEGWVAAAAPSSAEPRDVRQAVVLVASELMSAWSGPYEWRRAETIEVTARRIAAGLGHALSRDNDEGVAIEDVEVGRVGSTAALGFTFLVYARWPRNVVLRESIAAIEVGAVRASAFAAAEGTDVVAVHEWAVVRAATRDSSPADCLRRLVDTLS